MTRRWPTELAASLSAVTSLTFSSIGLYRFEFLPAFCPVSRLYTRQAVPSQGGIEEDG